MELKGVIIRHAKWKKIWQAKFLIESTGQDKLLPIDFEDLETVECDFLIQTGMPNEAKKYIDHVYEGIQKKKKPILVKELPVLRSVSGISQDSKNSPFDNQWYRFSWNHYFADEGIHPYDPSYNRWEELSKKYNINVYDWKRRGDAILFNCQLYGDSALSRIWDQGNTYEEVVFNAIDKIKQVSDRPIIIRKHPKDSKMKSILNKKYHDDKKITISDNHSLYQDLNRAWCTVTYNSTSCVESVLYGLPAFTLSSSSLTYSIIPNNLKDIEKNLEPDRTEWCNKISYMQWNGQEMKSGYPWKLLRDIIPS